MPQLTIELSDEIYHSLEGMAAAEDKSVEQFVLEQLTLLVTDAVTPAP
jgi:hypothetical protein